MKTIRRKALHMFYPLLMKAMQRSGKNRTVLHNHTGQLFQKPIYDLSITLNDGTVLPLHNFKGKKILVVNTASDCGYTAQYGELQQLQDRYPDALRVIGFPANDFKEQEKAGDEEIAQFCTRNFGISFSLAKKSRVVKGPQQHPVYQWLTDTKKNGWNEKAPGWNFSKYLMNKQGMLTHYFDPGISPLSSDMINAIET